MRLTNLTSEEKDAIYFCLRRCQGEYYVNGVLPLIDVSVVEKILEDTEGEPNG